MEQQIELGGADLMGSLPGNPWQQLLLSHFLLLGGHWPAVLMETASPWRGVATEPVRLALSVSCEVGVAHSEACWTICHLQPLASTNGTCFGAGLVIWGIDWLMVSECTWACIDVPLAD